MAALGPVHDAAHLVTVDEHMNDLQVAVDEHRCPWPQRRLRDLRIAPDNVGGHDIVGDEQPTLRIELWRTLEYLRVSHDTSGRERSNDEQHGDNERAAAHGGRLGKPYRDKGSASRYACKRRNDFDGLLADLDVLTSGRARSFR